MLNFMYLYRHFIPFRNRKEQDNCRIEFAIMVRENNLEYIVYWIGIKGSMNARLPAYLIFDFVYDLHAYASDNMYVRL